MSAGFDSLALPRPWRRKRHGLALGVAIIASVALHGTLLRVFPPLAIGRPPEEALLRTFAPVQLQNMVRSVDVPLLERPDPVRPRNRFVFRSERRAEDLRRSGQRTLAGQPAGGGASAARGNRAVERRSGGGRTGQVGTAPDILRIEEQLYAEAVSVLPARYVDLSRAFPKRPILRCLSNPLDHADGAGARDGDPGSCGGEALRDAAASVAFNPGAFTPRSASRRAAGMLDEPPRPLPMCTRRTTAQAGCGVFRPATNRSTPISPFASAVAAPKRCRFCPRMFS